MSFMKNGSYQSLEVIGNVGQDPREFSTQNGKGAGFSVATVDARGETLWIDCVTFGNNANYVLTNIKKGNKVFVEGAIQLREYNGQMRLQLVVHNIMRLSAPSRLETTSQSPQQPIGTTSTASIFENTSSTDEESPF